MEQVTDPYRCKLLASRLPLECSGFLEEDLEDASRFFRKELRGGEGMGAAVNQVFSIPVFCHKPIIKIVSYAQ